MCWEKFEDTKGVIRRLKWKKDRQYNGKKDIYKIPHTQLKIEQSEPHYKPVVDSGAVEGLAVLVAMVTSVVLLLS
jgi:hypothetical protein